MSLDSLTPLLDLIRNKKIAENDHNVWLTMREWMVVIAALQIASQAENFTGGDLQPGLRAQDSIHSEIYQDFIGIAYVLRRAVEGAARDAVGPGQGYKI